MLLHHWSRNPIIGQAFMHETMANVHTWRTQGARLPELEEEVTTLESFIAASIRASQLQLAAHTPFDAAYVKAGLIEEAAAHRSASERARLALGKLERARDGTCTTFSDLILGVCIEIQDEGAVQTRSLKAVWRGRDAESIPTDNKTHDIPVGKQVRGSVALLSSAPNIGGRIVIADRFSYTRIDGLVDPRTARPRAKVQTYDTYTS